MQNCFIVSASNMAAVKTIYRQLYANVAIAETRIEIKNKERWSSCNTMGLLAARYVLKQGKE